MSRKTTTIQISPMTRTTVEIKQLRCGDLNNRSSVHFINEFICFAIFQNYYYQIVNIDEIGSNDKPVANTSKLKMLLGSQEVTNEMKKLLIAKPIVSESHQQQKQQSQTPPPPSSSSSPPSQSHPATDAIAKSEIKPNVSTTSSSSSPATVPSKNEQ